MCYAFQNGFRLPQVVGHMLLVIAAYLAIGCAMSYGTPARRQPFELPRHGKPVLQMVAFTADSTAIVAGAFTESDGFRAWGVMNGERLHHFDWIKPAPVQCFAFSSDGKYLALNGNQIFDLQQKKELQWGNTPMPPLARKCCFTPDGTSLFVLLEASIDEISVPELTSRQRFVFDRKKLGTSSYLNYTLAISLDGKRIGGTLYGMRIWDLPSGKESASIKDSYGLRAEMSPDGRLVCTNESDLQLWTIGQPINGVPLLDPRSPHVFERSIAWSPDAKTVAVSDVNIGIMFVSVHESNVFSLPFSDKFSAPYLCFSPDGKKFAAANDEEIPILHLDSKKVVSINRQRKGQALFN